MLLRLLLEGIWNVWNWTGIGKCKWRNSHAQIKQKKTWKNVRTNSRWNSNDLRYLLQYFKWSDQMQSTIDWLLSKFFKSKHIPVSTFSFRGVHIFCENENFVLVQKILLNLKKIDDWFVRLFVLPFVDWIFWEFFCFNSKINWLKVPLCNRRKNGFATTFHFHGNWKIGSIFEFFLKNMCDTSSNFWSMFNWVHWSKKKKLCFYIA